MTSNKRRGQFQRYLGPFLAILIPVLLIYCLCLNAVWSTDHAVSFLQLDWSLFTRQSVALAPSGSFSAYYAGTSPSVDDFVLNGYYYTALAPGTPVMALPFATIGFLLDGHYSEFGNALLFSELFVALTNAVAAYIIFKIARFFFGIRTSIFLAFAYAFSTISWPFATFFFQSDTSSMFDVLAVYFALRATQKQNGGSYFDWLYCGLAVAGGLTVDYINAILIPIIGTFLFIGTMGKVTQKLESFSKLILFLAASIEGVVLIGTYNKIAFGNYLTSSEQLYLHSATPLGNFTFPLYLGLILNLFTPFRGLLLYCPILVLGIPGFYLMLRSKRTWLEGLFIMVVFLALLMPYSAWYGPTGGLSYGARFVIPSIPFLLIPAGYVAEKPSRLLSALTYTLYSIGVVTNGIAALTSALGPAEAPWLSSPFFTSALPNFLQGFGGPPAIDSWWKNSLGSLWWIGCLLIISSAILLPIFSERITESSISVKPVS